MSLSHLSILLCVLLYWDDSKPFMKRDFFAIFVSLLNSLIVVIFILITPILVVLFFASFIDSAPNYFDFSTWGRIYVIQPSETSYTITDLETKITLAISQSSYPEGLNQFGNKKVFARGKFIFTNALLCQPRKICPKLPYDLLAVEIQQIEMVE